MHEDLVGLAFRLPLLPTVAVLADVLLLFRVDAHDRLVVVDKGLRLFIQVGELGVPVRVIGPLLLLRRRLQAVAGCLQKAPDGVV